MQRHTAETETSLGNALPRWLVRELRSDHAGETGAVWIYRGILAITRDSDLREFSTKHMRTEASHQRALEAVLAPNERSVLLPIWRVAGWLTGALPALVGPRAVHVTIDVVESFVDEHYQAQIDALDRLQAHRELRNLLERCRLDEVEHRDEARELHGGRARPLAMIWTRMVALGSAAAAGLSRRI